MTATPGAAGPLPRVGVDVGGTFTDVALVTADGDLHTAKVPTTASQDEGAVRALLAACDDAGLDPADLAEFSHGTTVATNALLEDTGAEAALITTEGFRDVLELGRQDRPALYDLDADPTDTLVPRRRRYTVDERTTTAGVEREVTDEQVAELADDLRGADSVAVCLLHAYAHPANERRVAEGLRERLDVPVSASHEVLAAFREYERTATTAADAILAPVVDDYLRRLTDRATDRGAPAPRVMQSNGGVADAAVVREHPVTTALSGPAAGVVGARRTAAPVADERGLDGLVTVDMGGTSSDVSLVRDGEVARTTTADVGGHPVRVPMVDVTTVGSGGGSVAWVDDGGALQVGPRSAGADPGPACYGKGGGEPTVTDAALELGYLGADTALGGTLELDAGAARTVLADLADHAGLDGPLDAARGVFRVANAAATRAVRGVTVERGHDPRSFGLVAFGGAGPVFAAALADRLDVGTVVVPLAGGVLSAYGLLDADETHDAVRTHRTPLADADPDDLSAVYADLADAVLADVSAPDAATVTREADCRYAGQSFELAVDAGDPVDPDALVRRFHDAHERAHGYRLDEPAELVTCRATATVARSVPETAYAGGDGDPRTAREASFGGDLRETRVYDRHALPPGGSLAGPAVVEGAESTTVVPPGWTGTVREDGTLVLEASDD